MSFAKNLHRCLSLLGLIIIASCNHADSENVAVVLALGPPTPLPDPIVGKPDQPSFHFDGTNVFVEEKANPLREQVQLPDPGAESANNPGLIDSASLPTGFVATGDCLYQDNNVSASSGNWRFELGPDCTLMQTSHSVVAAGQAITLLFDTHTASNTLGQLSAQIIGTDTDGNTTILGYKDLTLTPDDNGWRSVQVTVDYAVADEYAGSNVGVRFINPDSTTHVSVDNIELNLFNAADPAQEVVFADSWQAHCNQLWAGQSYWSNRLQDWEVRDGKLQTRDANQYRPNRTTHRLSSIVSSAPADFSLKLNTGSINTPSSGSYSGMLLGAGARMDYRSAALIHNRHGRNGGLVVGIESDGRVFIQGRGIHNTRLANGITSTAASQAGSTLQLDAAFQANGLYLLKLYAINPDGEVISSTQLEVEPVRLLGNIALLSSPGSGNTAHWFNNWSGTGSKLMESLSRQFGPVLFASYTVSRNTLTVNAQYPPLCSTQMSKPVLQVMKSGIWESVAIARIDPEAHTARFQIENWDDSQITRYRIATSMQAQGKITPFYHEGVIQADPISEPDFVIGVFNCRPGLINSGIEGWIQQNNNQAFTWTRDRIVFPHEELLNNALKHDIDMVTFLGDQIYEFDPNGLVDKRPEHLVNDYLWKWYQFGWAAREIMRNKPSIILPDDHDVFQGNIWGQSGIAAEAQEDGGYIFPASFINIVQKTQAGSLPTPYSPSPLEQGIASYYTDIVYGGVGMAVLEDRKFKTGPNSPQRPLQLLGNAQHWFLDQWARNWQGQSMKLALSQSPFSQSTTHSGATFAQVKLDKDSNGWPKSGRDAAVQLLRKAFAPHIAGDQHLGMSLKHGIDLPNDAIYSFAGPSMLNIFPRIWDPLNNGDGPGDASREYRGEFTDAHGNFITVLAAANPAVYYQPLPSLDTPSKNDLGIGYGIVRVNKPDRQYTFEAWPANVDPLKPNATMYPHWPITVDQSDNDGRIPTGYLPQQWSSVDEPVVQVFSEVDNSLIYARRLASSTVILPVYDNDSSYRVVLSDPDSNYRVEFHEQRVE